MIVITSVPAKQAKCIDPHMGLGSRTAPSLVGRNALSRGNAPFGRPDSGNVARGGNVRTVYDQLAMALWRTLGPQRALRSASHRLVVRVATVTVVGGDPRLPRPRLGRKTSEFSESRKPERPETVAQGARAAA